MPSASCLPNNLVSILSTMQKKNPENYKESQMKDILSEEK